MIAVALLFIILGILIKYGKMYFLIAGYNTMPKTEKSKYDIERIASLFRNVIFGMALIIIIGYFTAKCIDKPQVETISVLIAIAIGVLYLLIKSNSKKFKINKL